MTSMNKTGYGAARYTYSKEMWKEIYDLVRSMRNDDARVLAELVDRGAMRDWHDATACLNHIRVIRGFVECGIYGSFDAVWKSWDEHQSAKPVHSTP